MSDTATTWAKAQPCVKLVDGVEKGDRNAKQVLVHMAPYFNAEGFGWAKVGLLAMEMEVSERTVQRGIQALIEYGYLIETDATEVYYGKVYPIYRMPLEEGHANTQRRIRAERAAGVTPVSPQDARGDTGVTARGDTGVALGVTLASPRILKAQDNSQSNLQGAGARASSDGFEALVAGWDRRALDVTDLPAARTAFAEFADEAGGPDLLIAAGLGFMADWAGQGRDYPPPALNVWLRRKSWAMRCRDLAAPAVGAKAGAAVTGWAGPAEVWAAVCSDKRLGEGWAASWLAPCAVDGSVVHPRNSVAADRLRQTIGALLFEHGLTIGEIRRGAV